VEDVKERGVRKKAWRVGTIAARADYFRRIEIQPLFAVDGREARGSGLN